MLLSQHSMAHKGAITQLCLSLANAKAKLHLPLPVLYLIWKKLTHSLKWEQNLTLRSECYFFFFPSETSVVLWFLPWVANPASLTSPCIKWCINVVVSCADSEPGRLGTSVDVCCPCDNVQSSVMNLPAFPTSSVVPCPPVCRGSV